MKTILKPYYTLKEAKLYNDTIASFEKQSCNVKNNQYVKKIFDLINITKVYDNENQYVVGSAKHTEILAKKAEYTKAQEELKTFSYICERVLEDNSITLTKHTFIVSMEDIDDDEYVYDNVDVSFTFFTDNRIIKHILIENFSSLYIDYIRDDRDLIDDAVNSIDAMTKVIFAYRLCEHINIPYTILEKIFDVKELVHYSDFIEYNGTRYYNSNIKKLVEEYNVAKELKYVTAEEKIISYPRELDFISFKNRGYKILK